MAKGLTLDIAANTRDFQRGTKDVEKSLDQVADSLDDVSRDGAKASEKLEKSFSDAQREISRDAKKIEKDVKDSTRDGFKGASDHVESFKDEARQNFAETASSFDGSMDSIADMAQSTLGGLATAIPGAGLALAGLGAAAGAFYSQWQENAEKTEERISNMYDDMLESGLDYLSQQYVNDALRDLKEDQDEYNRLVQLSKDLGLALSDVLIAQVTKGDERERVEQRITERYAEQLRLAGELEDGMTYTANEQARGAAELSRWSDHFETLNEQQSESLSTVKEIRIAQDQVNARYTEEGKLIDTNNKKLAEAPREVAVKYVVDDSALKNYRPAPLKVPIEMFARDGKRIY
ncbi:hypothetical protein FB562_1892 [Homoserinimonas aerilata]|uniref:Uncharacterized protein n=1 Tax=Homoserinimonas aerilata TaxID=1162970 RepID=A0A542YL15_9MICO|nr:hypothetical protein [Homoserinimonas aerilata]TQL48786.1 hypothetical protein FB562_1892 [Homoserinimonas aerilata]